MLARSFDHVLHGALGSRILSGPRLLHDTRSNEVVSVVERRADGVAGARRPACLIFSTDAGFTRVWFYPDNWQSLDDDKLIALTEHWRWQQSA